MAIKMLMRVTVINQLGLGEEEVRMRPHPINVEENATWNKAPMMLTAECNMMITQDAAKGDFVEGEEYEVTFTKVEKKPDPAAKKAAS